MIGALSSGSAAASTDSSAAASATDVPIGPAVSCARDSGTMPDRLTSPRVGLMPTTPQALDGETIDPSVSVPMASGANPADRPAAEPELDPDGLRSSAYGFAVCPPSVDQPLVERVDRKFAHSDRLAFARMIAPAARSREMMNASGGLAASSAGEPAVAGCTRPPARCP